MTDLEKFSILRKEKMAIQGLIDELEIDPETCDSETLFYYLFLEQSLECITEEMNSL